MPVVSSTPGGSTPISGMSSLASLLATPLSSLGPALVGRAVPLVLSSALPPVPARAVDKIRSGLFIDFKELLPDNVALSQRLAETSSLLSGAPPARLREVTDILTWISCFLYFVAARSEDSVTRDLMAYGLIVLHLARKHGGRGWLLYDATFRQQMAAGSLLAWTDLNASMMASTVLSAADPAGGHFCPLCQAVDHTRAECALAQLEPQAVKEPSREYRPKPYRRGECHRFNRVGGCSSSAARCKFAHRCSTCGKEDHGAASCPRRKSPSPPSA